MVHKNVFICKQKNSEGKMFMCVCGEGGCACVYKCVGACMVRVSMDVSLKCSMDILVSLFFSVVDHG